MKTLLNNTRMIRLSTAMVLTVMLTTGLGKQSLAAGQSDVTELARASLLTLQIGQASLTAITEKNEEAFSRLRNNRQQLSAALALLQAGALKQQVASLAENSLSLDRNISTLLEQEGALRRFSAANEKVNELEATLVELSEEILGLTLAHQGSTPEVMAATQLILLNQRLVKNFNLLNLENAVEAETIFLIGKDSQTLHGLIRELTKGSSALGLAPAHPEINAKLQQLASSFSEVESLVVETMKDMPQLLAIKRASVAIQEKSGGLQMQLLQLLSTRSAV